MDLTNAAILVAVVFGLVELVKALIPAISVSPRLTVAVVVVIAVVAVFLVGETVWAHEQVIGNHPLDQINWASKLVVAVFLAGAAAFGDKALTAVKNIGENQVQKPIAK